MKLTCVTATFNAIKAGNRESLIRCVESVAKLKTEHEHLIYDGASTDGTVELLRELEAKTSGLKVVSEPDGGIFDALNKGVRDARGEWFYVLGCDDYICNPNVLDGLLSHVDAAAQMVVSPVCRDDGEIFGLPTKDLWRIMLSGAYSHQGVLMRTALVRSFGAFECRFFSSADYDMCLKAHRSGTNVQYTLEPYAFYAKGGLSDTTRAGVSVDATVQYHFMISDQQAKQRYMAGYPFSRIFPFLFHEDLALRTSARFLFWKRLKWDILLPIYPLRRLHGIVAKRMRSRTH